MAGNANYDALLTTTLANVRENLEDNVFNARALTYWLTRKDRIKTKTGGNKIVEPLIYAENSTVGSFSSYDTLDTTPQEGISAAEYDWKSYAGTVAIAGDEEDMNRGPEEVLDLLESKVMQTEESISEGLNSMFFSNGSGNSGKDWWGLAAIVEASDPSIANFGNIDRDTNSWWQSYEENTAGALTLAYMATAYNTVSKGNIHPDFLITTQTLYEKYEALLQPQLRFSDNKTVDGGFQNFLYKDAVLMFDTDCTSGVMYFLNSKYLKLVKHSNTWFKNTPFQAPHDQDARYSKIILRGNLVASNCKRLGKLTAKTA
jgi:hypothetical protein